MSQPITGVLGIVDRTNGMLDAVLCRIPVNSKRQLGAVACKGTTDRYRPSIYQSYRENPGCSDRLVSHWSAGRWVSIYTRVLLCPCRWDEPKTKRLCNHLIGSGISVKFAHRLHMLGNCPASVSAQRNGIWYNVTSNTPVASLIRCKVTNGRRRPFSCYTRCFPP